MRVVFFGQTGIEKSRMIETLAGAIEEQFRPKSPRSAGASPPYIGKYRLEDYIRKDNTSFIKWLASPSARFQSEAWTGGFDRLEKDIKRNGEKNIFLEMHATYYHRSRFFSPIDRESLRRFKPDLMITLYDDIYDIWWRIMQRRGRFLPSGSLRLRELSAWRSIEIMMADTIAANLGSTASEKIPHFVVAAKHPLDMIRKLLTNPYDMRVYASYPISRTRDRADKRREIDKYRRDLHDRFIVFDPVSIDERMLHKAYKRRSGKANQTVRVNRSERWPLPSQGLGLELLSKQVRYPQRVEGIDISEVVELFEAEAGRGGEVNEQIVWRDFRLVDQAHCLAAYRPEFEGKLSGGVSAELGYAASSRYVHPYQYTPKEDAVGGPFDSLAHTFTDYNQFLKGLEELQNNIRREKSHPSHRGKWDT